MIARPHPLSLLRAVPPNRRVVFMNAGDLSRLGIQKDQWVDLLSPFESETRRAERFKVIPYEIPAGCAAAYYPETNVLAPIRSVADDSNQPASKSITITLEPTGLLAAEFSTHGRPLPDDPQPSWNGYSSGK
jgi:anaerobic selenocysteine-containing dehydrogenase